MATKVFRVRPFWPNGGGEEVEKDVPVDEAYLRTPAGRAAEKAAELFAEEWCQQAAKYDPMDVQVLLPEGWVTFEVVVHTVPEFEARRKVPVPAPAAGAFQERGLSKKGGPAGGAA